MSTDLLSVASEALRPAKHAGYIVTETGEGPSPQFWHNLNFVESR